MADRDLTKAYSRAQFVAKLRRLADAIESGIEHERSGNEQELEFQLLWESKEG
jgi:hypothetical protein